MKKNLLIVAAHPDDEVLGCAGTVSRLIKEGYTAHTLILGKGVRSRADKNDFSAEIEDKVKLLEIEARKANKLLGVKDIMFCDFPDNSFDSVPLLDIIKEIEPVIKKTKPEIIFTHYGNDLNVDHRITCNAVQTATRPAAGTAVKTIYSFEVMSSTEWNFPLTFSPDVFFDVSKTIGLKKKALGEYKMEMKTYPHPRSIEAVVKNAEMWGIKAGVRFAEAFKLIRDIK